ncbi:hypothetical protein D3C84_995140 [compost metagenome]
MAAIKIKGNDKKRAALLISYEGILNDATAVNATIITIMVETRLDCTTTVPITIPPTTPIVCPIGLANLTVASLNISSVNNMNIASSTGGIATYCIEL